MSLFLPERAAAIEQTEPRLYIYKNCGIHVCKDPLPTARL